MFIFLLEHAYNKLSSQVSHIWRSLKIELSVICGGIVTKRRELSLIDPRGPHFARRELWKSLFTIMSAKIVSSCRRKIYVIAHASRSFFVLTRNRRKQTIVSRFTINKFQSFVSTSRCQDAEVKINNFNNSHISLVFSRNGPRLDRTWKDAVGRRWNVSTSAAGSRPSRRSQQWTVGGKLRCHYAVPLKSIDIK